MTLLPFVRIRHKLPPQIVLGLGLIAVAWPVAWLQVAPLSYFTFLYLWLGYILTLDGLNVIRHGSSPLTRAPLHFAGLFALSAPVWWLFEFLNNLTQNWHYLGGQVYGSYADLVATVHFATVIPAVFETWELGCSFDWTQRAANLRPTIVNRFLEVTTFALGWVSLTCVFVNPSFSFGLVWLWLLLVLDPLNAWLSRPALIRQIARGDWRNVVALATAGLICGFFWEMWNYYSYPKWYYTLPHVAFLKIFEMPLLGYLGYIPFPMELYALYQCVNGIGEAVLGRATGSLRNAGD